MLETPKTACSSTRLRNAPEQKEAAGRESLAAAALLTDAEIRYTHQFETERVCLSLD